MFSHVLGVALTCIYVVYVLANFSLHVCYLCRICEAFKKADDHLEFVGKNK